MIEVMTNPELVAELSKLPVPLFVMPNTRTVSPTAKSLFAVIVATLLAQLAPVMFWTSAVGMPVSGWYEAVELPKAGVPLGCVARLKVKLVPFAEAIAQAPL